MRSALNEPSVWQKIQWLRQKGEALLPTPSQYFIPFVLARDIQVVAADELPAKVGLTFATGQARLLHDLASIELQAMELGVRTLIEFPEAPAGFREELWAVTLSEAQHLELCLRTLQQLGFEWGDWPVHVALWMAASDHDSLLDRILIVHRYLEGSGLDAGDTLLRRLYGMGETPVHAVAKRIVKDEIGHVEFGSRWYREVCRQEKIDPQQDFGVRLEKLRWQIPKRIEPLSRELRKRAGFNQGELLVLEKFRTSMAKHQPKNPAGFLKPYLNEVLP